MRNTARFSRFLLFHALTELALKRGRRRAQRHTDQHALRQIAHARTDHQAEHHAGRDIRARALFLLRFVWRFAWPFVLRFFSFAHGTSYARVIIRYNSIEEPITAPINAPQLIWSKKAPKISPAPMHAASATPNG